MKVFLFLIGIVAAGLIGYSFEPDIYKAVTGKAPERKKVEPKPEVVRTAEPTDEEVEPEPEVLETVVEPLEPAEGIDPASVPADQLPEKVVLKADAEISNEAGDLRMTVTAGNRVDLVRLDGPNAIISPGPGPLQGSIPVSQTDLAEQLVELAKNPPAEPIPEQPIKIVENGTAAQTEDAIPIPESESGVEPEPEPVVEAEPEPEPAPEPTPEPAPAGNSDVVSVMQTSIRNGDIKEFTFDQVLDWQPGEGDETVEGETYQTGIASYKAETVFGVKTIQAKALIKNGKVVRWLWPKSGMEIK